MTIIAVVFQFVVADCTLIAVSVAFLIVTIFISLPAITSFSLVFTSPLITF